MIESQRGTTITPRVVRNPDTLAVLAAILVGASADQRACAEDSSRNRPEPSTANLGRRSVRRRLRVAAPPPSRRASARSPAHGLPSRRSPGASVADGALWVDLNSRSEPPTSAAAQGHETSPHRAQTAPICRPRSPACEPRTVQRRQTDSEHPANGTTARGKRWIRTDNVGKVYSARQISSVVTARKTEPQDSADHLGRERTATRQTGATPVQNAGELAQRAKGSNPADHRRQGSHAHGITLRPN